MIHLIAVQTTTKASELAWIYIQEVVRLHELPDSIVSDRDSKFKSKFWKEVHRLLGTKLLMSTSFHPQTDGASERAIRSVGQLLRVMVRPDQKNWRDKIPMAEFAINSSISGSTGFALFELNYGYMPTFTGGITPVETAQPGVKQFVQRAIDNMVHQEKHLCAETT
jgi:transposase InsO family protein